MRLGVALAALFAASLVESAAVADEPPRHLRSLVFGELQLGGCSNCGAFAGGMDLAGVLRPWLLVGGYFVSASAFNEYECRYSSCVPSYLAVPGYVEIRSSPRYAAVGRVRPILGPAVAESFVVMLGGEGGVDLLLGPVVLGAYVGARAFTARAPSLALMGLRLGLEL